MRQREQKMRASRELELPDDLARAYAALHESPESVTQRLREEVDYPLWVAEGLAGTEEPCAARQRVIRILGNP